MKINDFLLILKVDKEKQGEAVRSFMLD